MHILSLTSLYAPATVTLDLAAAATRLLKPEPAKCSQDFFFDAHALNTPYGAMTARKFFICRNLTLLFLLDCKDKAVDLYNNKFIKFYIIIN